MTALTNGKTEKNRPPWKNPIAVIGAIILFWPTSLIIINKYLSAYKDSFDGTSSLFSALAFGGVIIAIFLQQQELEDTRAVLAGQEQQLKDHTQVFKKQNFESTFFSLLNMHHIMVNAIKHDFGPLTIPRSIQELALLTHGRDCFKEFYTKLKEHHDILIQNNMAPNDPRVIDLAYGRLHDAYQSSIGHYFRHLYNIVRFIKDSDIDDKAFYVRLVRAQLSVFELSLLFYNCLSPLGKDKFKPLVEEFTLLKTVEDKYLINPAHRYYYAPSAFETPSSASTV